MDLSLNKLCKKDLLVTADNIVWEVVQVFDGQGEDLLYGTMLISSTSNKRNHLAFVRRYGYYNPETNYVTYNHRCIAPWNVPCVALLIDNGNVEHDETPNMKKTQSKVIHKGTITPNTSLE